MMHKKVKVWGKETTCNMCEYIEVFDHKDLCCRKTGRVIKGKDYEEVEELFNQCPFKVSINEENLAYLGFKLKDFRHFDYNYTFEKVIQDSSVKKIYTLEYVKLPRLDSTETRMYDDFIVIKMQTDLFNQQEIILYNGKIYNLVELEFILKNIGAIK